ncbi:inositol monophosphatase family protein [Pseudomonas abietaniphila]|uniref:Myo-inositol-1(Or 4)-monophosphatase n=1 Tax=Pseudomonas abietaniphila TaxID=89065 RepID=A0A1G8SFI9_9PSED|nr:inositol monophosphatase family protein [Pseudomonas abietaniphila]SDJ28026.1 myo-inositol-1(or 4)-monophosphatase [Pseudomonas abietaniphila]
MATLEFQQTLPAVIEVVQRTGVLISSESARPGGPRGSGDKADVDIVIEVLLRKELLEIVSADWWGEETPHSLTGKALCWVVDPNDGTSDFLSGLKGSAISVGLLQNGQPVLGVVYAPVTPHGIPDCIAWAVGMDHLVRNGQPVVVDLSNQELSGESKVMVSAAADRKPEINRELCAPGHFDAMPSIAYRLARVAAGDGVCGVSLYSVSAHDVVAGHALLVGSKGVLIDENGLPIRYETDTQMARVSNRCFGGAASACLQLYKRDWNKVFA